MQEQSVDISLVIQKNQRGIGFMVLTIVWELLKLKIQGSLKMVKLVGVQFHKMWKLSS